MLTVVETRPIETELRDILKTHGRLSVSTDRLGRDDNLFNAGLSSLATVNLMLAIEDTFEVEIPDDRLSRATFSSIGSLCDLVRDLLAERGLA